MSVCVRGREVVPAFYMQAGFLRGICPLENQRIHGVVGYLPEILLCYSLAKQSIK